MNKRSFLFLLLLIGITLSATGQKHTLSGKVVSARDYRPVEFSTVFLPQSELWAVTNDKGEFVIRQVPEGKTIIEVQCLGYVKNRIEINVRRDSPVLQIILAEDNLKLDEVEVVAQKQTDGLSTSYTIDRNALDHAQILNLANVSGLLPGGKVTNGTLINDPRLALRSESLEKGNPSFGTAVEIDGVRLQNNAEMGETLGASMRGIGSAHIESVEVITGIPSVEYGDLSNGMVKVNTRKGKTPFIVDLAAHPHTKQVAVSKGFALGSRSGVLNAGFEHTRSIDDLVSPYTAYARNAFHINYSHTLLRKSAPLSLTVGLAGNLGGYNSESDPDLFLGTYAKVRDHSFRGSLKADWLLNKSWITHVELNASFSYADKASEVRSRKSSASAQPYIHTAEEGYAIATEYDSANPYAPIILGPTGYWYELAFVDSKPMSYAVKLKAGWARRFGEINHRLLVGGEWTGSGNEGRGAYYDDMRHTPTWRPYRYDEQPYVNHVAGYAEEKLTIPTTSRSTLELMAGLRGEATVIARSDYGTPTGFSPRFNARYHFWKRADGAVSSLSVYGGWGKAVKFPSSQVLYPLPSYADLPAFTPGSTSDGKAFYAYYTYPVKPQYNANLKWQYTRQMEFGVEATVKGTKISLSAFHHKTYRPYMRVLSYVPFTYKLTQQKDLEQSTIPFARQTYTVDSQTGVVTVHDTDGALASEQLTYTDREVFRAVSTYVNASPVVRSGLEWVIDFAKIPALRTSFRIDGNYYHYHGTDETLIAWSPGSAQMMADGRPYRYVGYYGGSNAYSTSYAATASVGNGSLSDRINTNLTVKTHIPKLRLIFSLRLESTFYNYDRPLSEYAGGTQSVVLESRNDYFGVPYTKNVRDKYIATYPVYYSTLDEPGTKIPFYEKLVWAKDNDVALYNELVKLVQKTNYGYTFNPERISSYFSANFSVTKEIGDFASLSFYANNFFNHMGRVKSSRTGLETSLYGSGYIPSFYYGLSLRLKI